MVKKTTIEIECDFCVRSNEADYSKDGKDYCIDCARGSLDLKALGFKDLYN